jgi:SAM-dependent methyltransferase
MDARDWDRRWEEQALHVHGEPSPVVADVLGDSSPGRALDLGCGTGRNAVWLAEHGWQVTGVDFSPEALRQARERAAAQEVAVDWVEADLRTYEPPTAAFDLVLVAYVHLPADERRAVLSGAAAAVAQGGVLVVVGHDLANLGTGAPGPSSAAVLYAPSDIVPELPALTVLRAEQVRRPVEVDDGTVVEAVDALVVATTP